MFEIIPALEIRAGNDPLASALKWQAEGATRLHIVGLDGARDGQSANIDLIRRIDKAVGIPIQFSGGLIHKDAIQAALDAGIERCIIDVKAVHQPQWAQQMFAEFGDAIILGIAAQNGMVVTEGAHDPTGVPALHFAQAMQEFGCRRIVYTDSVRHGTLAGPDAAAVRAIAEGVEIPIIARGGVHKATDVRILCNIPNVAGVIVGRALHEGIATLRQLQHAADISGGLAGSPDDE